MSLSDNNPGRFDQLRRRAEDALLGKPVDLDGLNPEDIQTILHELQVHQVELRMQNDELRRVQQELEVSRDLYSDLFEFAPVGYCTLDRRDRILETNQTLTSLLKIDQAKLIHKKLGDFVEAADQDRYYLHRQRAFAGEGREVCNVCMVMGAGDVLVVRLESTIVSRDPSKLRVTLSDITEQRRMENAAMEAATHRELQHLLLDQREQERLQIARDLHDGPVQELTAVTFTLQRMLIDKPDPELAVQLEEIKTALQTQITDMRNYASELRPPSLSKFGLEQAINSSVDTFIENHPGIHIKLEMDHTGLDLPEAIRLALFRIYQQALANVLKHAGASQVRVQLSMNGRVIHLRVQDNGRGFELPADWLELAHAGHLGLLGMRERAEAVGGMLEIISHPGNGTLVHVVVPPER
jgi:PAS domain S-box-containing protein